MTKYTGALLIGLFVLVLAGSVGAQVFLPARPFGHAEVGPARGARYAEVSYLNHGERIGRLSAVVDTIGQGGNAFEAYTTLSGGHSSIAFGSASVIEVVNGSSDRAVALEGNIVVSGPGVIGRASNLFLPGVQRHSSWKGPINVQRVDYVTFGNGWSFRPGDGGALLVCDPANRCKPFSVD